MTDQFDLEFDFDEDEGRVPTVREALRSLRAAAAQPFRLRHRRARRWWARLRSFDIDWSGFAVTRGGFFQWLMPEAYVEWPHGRPPERVPMLIASGGWCAPSTPYYGETGWVQWGRWYCWREIPWLPPLQVARGGISYVSAATP